MSKNDSQNKNEKDQGLADHLAFAVEAIGTWPAWQQGLLQASGQQKLQKPRTIKAGVKPKSDEGKQ